MSQSIEDVTIIGTGPAGLTAAIYAARANLNPLCVEGTQPGGQLTITSDVENYPGFAEGIMGPQLMDDFRKQAERFGTRFVVGDVQRIDLSKAPYTLEFANGSTAQTRTLIISTGASARWLGIESEKKLMGKGVSACATCDGFFFKDQDVVVVGGGDSAMEEATFLTKFAKSVTLIHRREVFRASKIMLERAQKNEKIKFLTNTTIDEILGDKGVEGVRLKNTQDGSTREMKAQGVFMAIGHVPNTSLFKGALEMDESGYLVVQPGSTRTNIPGVFAAGDVADKIYRQAVTAAGTGCMAAIDSEKYLENQGAH